jgi:hypothetical protein
MMSVGQGPSSSGEPKAGDEGPRLDPLGFRQWAKQRQRGACRQGATKWARHLPHVYEHKCLAMTKRGRGSAEGVDDLISDSGNNHDDSEASLSESHCLLLVL